MIINDLEFILVQVGRAESTEPVRSVLVRLTTDSGLEGWGEGDLPWRPDELAARREAILPVLAGRSIFDIEELLGSDALADPALRCALEIGFWDLIGRTVGQPLCHLFGGEYRQRIPVTVRLRGPDTDRLGHLARELAEQGFHSQTVTCRGSIDEDLEAFRTVHQSVADRAELRLDGAAKFDLDSARDLCAELERDELQFFLDPLKTPDLQSPDLQLAASLRRQTSVPLAVCRAIRGPGELLAAIRAGAAPLVVVDPSRVGGLTMARKCAAVAQAGEMAVVLGGGGALGIGTAAMLQLAASTPAFSNSNECDYHQLHDDVLREPLEVVDGMMAVPQAPGLGVEVDRGKVERYQVT